ncbi:MAG: hypothetical protein K2X47_09240 [Bdellovibrionales bacterium]|nr:hypothetical protein [Bdellovibrionales bacterium]
MTHLLLLFLSSAATWCFVLILTQALMPRSLKHPHRRRRDLGMTVDVSRQVSTKLFIPIIPLGALLFLLFMTPALNDPAFKISGESRWRICFFFGVIFISFFELVRACSKRNP